MKKNNERKKRQTEGTRERMKGRKKKRNEKERIK
jgi:hypothetical protein